MCAVYTERSRAGSEAFWSAGANCCPEGASFAGGRRSEGSPSYGALFTERGAQLKDERNTEQDKKGYGMEDIVIYFQTLPFKSLGLVTTFNIL